MPEPKQAQTKIKTCPICDGTYEPADYLLHLQEEILKQLLLLNDKMHDVSDALTLTYQYMQTENDYQETQLRPPVIADDEVDDEVDDEIRASSNDEEILDLMKRSIEEKNGKPTDQ